MELGQVGPGDSTDITGRAVRSGRTGRRPLTAGDLAEVATLYRQGGSKPTHYVAEMLGISDSAAAKRVVKARAAGLLEPTTQGRVGGPVTKKGRKR